MIIEMTIRRAISEYYHQLLSHDDAIAITAIKEESNVNKD